MKRILWFVNGVMPAYAKALGRRPSNSGGWLTGLANILKERNSDYQLTIACYGNSPDMTVDGVSYRTIIGPVGSLFHPSNEHALMNSMRHCIDSVKPDLIHFHGTENGFQNYYAKLNMAYPTLTTVQGIVEKITPWRLGGIQLNVWEQFKNPVRMLVGRDKFNQTIQYYDEQSRFEHLIYERGGCFSGRTEFDRSWVLQQNSRSSYFTIGECLGDEFYRPVDRCGRNSHVIFAGGALRSPLKGGHWLIEAVGMLKSKYPDVRLRIADSDRFGMNTIKRRLFETRYEKYIRTLVKRYDVSNHITFLPSLNATQVRKELLGADVYCLASLCENSPNSLGEAMMSKTPIVATDVGGVASMVTSNTAILVESKDGEALAKAIDSVFSDPVSASSRAESAYKDGCKRFAREKVLEDLTIAYKAVMENRR